MHLGHFLITLPRNEDKLSKDKVFKTKSVASLVQKQAQLDEEGHQALFDVCCLWVYLKPKLEENFPAPIVQKCENLFQKG